MKRLNIWLATFLVFALAGCQTPPRLEYSLARSAVRAARDADAPRFAPGYWHKAMSTYREGKRFYENREHSDAKLYFKRARVLAERAENAAQLARAKGDGSF